VLIKHLSLYNSQKVKIKGWAYNHRSSGKVSFVEVRDGSGFVQGVFEGDKDLPIAKIISELTQECVVEIEGVVTKHFKLPDTYELQLEGISILSPSPNYPIARKEHGVDFLLGLRHLWLRSPKQWAIQRIRDQLIRSCFNFFNEHDFIKIDSPIIGPVACEGTTTLFDINYFDLGKAYLSQSGQLYLEAAIFSHGRVFDFGPVFRAEKSNTRKHLIEFWMLDAEMAFVDHQENMNLQEKFCKRLLKDVLSFCQKELSLLKRETTALEKARDLPFIRKSYTEIIELIKNKNGPSISYGEDFGAEHESFLSELFDLPLFIEKWPTHIKAFYMKQDPNNPDLVLGADLMASEGFGELIGGSQREDDYDQLLKKMKHEKMPLEDFQWYLDLRKYGSCVHSGFGIGLERMIYWVCGLEHIRESIPFPRLYTRNRP